MIHFIKNKSFFKIFLISIFVSILISINLQDNLILHYTSILSTFSVRYFLVIISVTIEYLVYKYSSDYFLIIRSFNKEKYLKKIIIYELIISFIFIGIFNFIIMLKKISFPTSNILFFIELSFNFLIIYFLISFIIKIIALFINKHIIASIIFIFIYSIIDFSTEYALFFILSKPIFNMSYTYTFNYYYKDGKFIICLIIILLNFIMYLILKLNIKRKDLIFSKYENN